MGFAPQGEIRCPFCLEFPASVRPPGGVLVCFHGHIPELIDLLCLFWFTFFGRREVATLSVHFGVGTWGGSAGRIGSSAGTMVGSAGPAGGPARRAEKFRRPHGRLMGGSAETIGSSAEAPPSPRAAPPTPYAAPTPWAAPPPWQRVRSGALRDGGTRRIRTGSAAGRPRACPAFDGAPSPAVRWRRHGGDRARARATVERA